MGITTRLRIGKAGQKDFRGECSEKKRGTKAGGVEREAKK